MNRRMGIIAIGALSVTGVAAGALIALPSPASGSPGGGPYPRNAKGETYGNELDAPSYSQRPDLIRTMTTDGRVGYVKKSDQDPDPKNPQELLAMANAKKAPREIPVYAEDGSTKIGTVTVLPPSFGSASGPPGTSPGDKHGISTLPPPPPSSNAATLAARLLVDGWKSDVKSAPAAVGKVPGAVRLETYELTGDKTLQVSYSGTPIAPPLPCSATYRSTLIEGAHAVTVVVLPISADPPGTACAASGVRKVLQVTMNADLGNRVVLDPFTGQPLPRRQQ